LTDVAISHSFRPRISENVEWIDAPKSRANGVVREGWKLSENRSEAGQDKMAIRYIYIFRRNWILGV
jgi:hypothetical protein